MLHHSTTYYITSHHIRLYHTTSCPSCATISLHIIYHLTVSHNMILHHIISFYIILYKFKSRARHVILDTITTDHIRSITVILYMSHNYRGIHIRTHEIPRHHLTLYHIRSSNKGSYHFIKHHITQYDLI